MSDDKPEQSISTVLETQPAPSAHAPAKPDLAQTIAVLGGGALRAFLDEALGETARGVRVVDEARVKGKLTLELTFERSKGGDTLLISHKGAYKRPTPTGDLAETIHGETQLYANERGALTLVPERQGRLF